MLEVAAVVYVGVAAFTFVMCLWNGINDSEAENVVEYCIVVAVSTVGGLLWLPLVIAVGLHTLLFRNLME